MGRRWRDRAVLETEVLETSMFETVELALLELEPAKLATPEWAMAGGGWLNR